MPNLQLVPVAQVRFHEHPERSRTQRLVARLREEALLRNTPIVADMDNGEYLLLDGANRVSAFRELGYSHVPVQVVDYGDERVQLKGWHHLLVNGRGLELARRYRELEGVRTSQTVSSVRFSCIREIPTEEQRCCFRCANSQSCQ